MSAAHAARFGWREPRFDCVLAGERSGTIVGAYRMALDVDARLDALSQVDAVIVPAYLAPPLGWSDADGPRFPPRMLDWLRAQHARGALVCGILSGTYALAAAGLLHGERATTHWIEHPELARLYPDVLVDPQRALCVAGRDGRIVTIGSNGAYHNDVVEYLVARLFGAAVVDTLDGMRGLSVARHGADVQAWLEARGNRVDAQVRAAQSWLAEHFAEVTPVRAVCERLGVSDRPLSRRFRQATGMTLLAYVQALRIANGQRLLERTKQPIEDIAAAVGYTDVATFREQFRRHVGMNPGRYRRSSRPGAIA